MPINRSQIKEYLQQQIKLAGIQETLSATYLDSAINFGGSLFWRNSWYFAERKKQITLTAGTAEYNADNMLETGVDAIIGMQRLSSSDYGFDVIEETPEAFDHLYPYPTAHDNGECAVYKVYYKNGKLYFTFFPPPVSAYTIEVTYRLGWDENRLALIPDNFVDVFMEACMIYALTPELRAAQRNSYERIIATALQENTPSRRKVPGVREPGYRSAMSDADIALNRGHYYADDDF